MFIFFHLIKEMMATLLRKGEDGAGHGAEGENSILPHYPTGIGDEVWEQKVKSHPRNRNRKKIRLPSDWQTGNQSTLDQGYKLEQPSGGGTSIAKGRLSSLTEGFISPRIRANVYLALILAKHLAERFPCIISCNPPNSPFLCFHWSYHQKYITETHGNRNYVFCFS